MFVSLWICIILVLLSDLCVVFSHPVIERPINDDEYNTLSTNESYSINIPFSTFSSTDFSSVYMSLVSERNWLNQEYVPPKIKSRIGNNRFGGEASDIVVRGNYAFVANKVDFVILECDNISDIEKMRVVGRIQHINADKIVLDGNYSYVVHDDSDNLFPVQFRIIDVSDVYHPFVVSVFYPPREYYQAKVFYAVSNNVMYYVDHWNYPMKVFDFSNKTNPNLVGVTSSSVYGEIKLLSNDLIFVRLGLVGDQGIVVFNATSIIPQYVTKILPSVHVYGMFVDDNNNILYCGVDLNAADLYILNITDIHSPEVISILSLRLPSSSDADRMLYRCDQIVLHEQKKILYARSLSSGHGIVIVNVSDHSHPSIIRFMSYSDSKETYMFYDHNSLFIPLMENGIMVYNVTTPTNPINLATWDEDDLEEVLSARIDISNDRLFLTDVDAGFVIVDISNTSNPVFLGELHSIHTEYVIISTTSEFAICFGDVFSANDLRQSIAVVSISNEKSPQIVNHWGPEGEADNSVFVSQPHIDKTQDGNYYLYVLYGASILDEYFLLVFDINDLPNLVLACKMSVDPYTQTFPIPRLDTAFFVSHEHVFISETTRTIYEGSSSHNVHGIKVYNFHNKTNPKLVSVIEFSEFLDDTVELRDICVTDDFRYVHTLFGTRNGGDRWYVLDISKNISNPNIVFQRSITPTHFIVIERNFAFVSRKGELEIFNVTIMSEPKYLLLFEFSNLAEELMYPMIKNNHIFAPYAKYSNPYKFIFQGIMILDFGNIILEGFPPYYCGDVTISVRGQDDEGSETTSYKLKLNDQCTSDQGNCAGSECVCVDDTKYYGKMCEKWKCNNIRMEDEFVCDQRGNCSSVNNCTCEEKYFGGFCETISCFGTPADDHNVCGGHGKCNIVDFCDCMFGYFKDENGLCSIWNCGKYRMDSEYVCNQKGKCNRFQECSCVNNWDGDVCDSFSCGGKDHQDANVCSGRGKCLSPAKCDCNYGYSGEICEKNELVAPFVSVSASFVGIFILCCCCVCLGLVCCVFLICVVSLFILVIKIFRQRSGLRYFQRLDDFDILLQEQLLDKDTTIPHLKINKSLFEVEYDEIKVQRVLGEGGSEAVVYLAMWRGTKVAFKCFQTRRICSSQLHFDGFEKEVNLLGNISHPHIIRFFGATLKPPRVGIVMEYCENGEILHFFQKHERSPYPMIEKLRMCQEIIMSIQYLHSRRIIHRDVKSENVLIDSNERCKLMDFGLSRVIEKNEGFKTARIGTSVYMAPEILKGDYDEKCDMFSFGILLFVVFTEMENPYGTESTVNIEFRVANDEKFRPNVEDLKVPISSPVHDDQEKNFKGSEERNNPENEEEEESHQMLMMKEDSMETQLIDFLKEIIPKCWKAESKERYSFDELSSLLQDWKSEFIEGKNGQN